VLVRIVASGTNPVDAKFRSGGDAIGFEVPIIVGSDVSGVVEEVGTGVTDLEGGDEVYCTPEVFGSRANGGYAEYNDAAATILGAQGDLTPHYQKNQTIFGVFPHARAGAAVSCSVLCGY
jgi:NADPH:quinone reductase